MLDAKTLVVIPTYNERGALPILIDALRGLPLDILVIDDGSLDGTGEYMREQCAQHPSIHLVQRGSKQGLGSAYRDGFRWALERGYDIVVQMDADGSHDPHALRGLLEKAQDAELVIGSRYVKGGSISHWSYFRLLVSRIANIYINAILRFKDPQYHIKDSTSGYKIWKTSLLERIGITATRSDGYAFQIETSWAAVKAHARIEEVAITFRDRTIGASKIGRSNILDTLLLPWRL